MLSENATHCLVIAVRIDIRHLLPLSPTLSSQQQGRLANAMYDRSEKDQPGLEVNANQDGLYTLYPVTNYKVEHLGDHNDVSKTQSDRRSWQNPFGLRPLWFALLIAFTTAIVVGAVVGGVIGGTMARSSSKDSSRYDGIQTPHFYSVSAIVLMKQQQLPTYPVAHGSSWRHTGNVFISLIHTKCDGCDTNSTRQRLFTTCSFSRETLATPLPDPKLRLSN